jgi:hypothetical protein
MNAGQVARRLALCVGIGVLVAWGMNEVTFRLLRTDSARSPEKIELLIPDGTADRVRRGETVPAIPQGMVFVIGDTLTVNNQDSADHQLGPFFIPAKSATRLEFKTAEKYSYSCTFSPDDFFGLDVRLPVTPGTRFAGAVFAGLPLGVLIGLYSLALGSSSQPKKQA